jgi:hypothetical protein
MSAALRTCLVCCALAIGSTCIRADSDAGDTSTIELVRRPVIDASKLADMRGGLSIAGLEYSIAAVMRTRVDGSVVLESAIDFDNVTNANVANSFVLKDVKGLTEVTHNLNKDQIVATVINEANQRQIQVELGINVTLHNYEALQASSVRNRILNSLGASLSD